MIVKGLEMKRQVMGGEGTERKRGSAPGAESMSLMPEKYELKCERNKVRKTDFIFIEMGIMFKVVKV